MRTLGIPTRGEAAASLFLVVALFACSNTVSSPLQNDAERPADGDGNGVAGGFWATQCASCHGEFGGSSSISSGNVNGDFRLDAESALLKHGDGLEAYINETMPLGATANCRGECAKVTGAYVRSRIVSGPDLSACESTPGVRFGTRSVKLLTSREYQRALEELLGIDADFGATVANNDGTVGGFTNMAAKSAGDTILETYTNNAEAIAALAISNGQPFACTDANACAQRFVDEFLYEAFRGQVTAGQRSAYLELFSSFGTDALPLALEAALTSPYFLYRIEAGVSPDTAIERGYYEAGEIGVGAAIAGDVIGSIPANQFPQGSGRLEESTWLFTENGSVEVGLSAPASGDFVVEVDARGTNHGALWPALELLIDGQPVVTWSIDDPSMRVYSFEVGLEAGERRVRLSFNNDSGEPPYGPGQDANLYIQTIRLRATVDTPSAPAPTPISNPLEGLPDDAFVLTPLELASAMSFMLTGGPPDTALLSAAENNALTSVEQIRAQVSRLIDSAAGRAHVGQFVSEWFHLDRVRSASRPDVADFTPEVRDAMVREVQAHFEHVFYDESVPFQQFYDGDYTFLNSALAQFYGVPGDFGTEFVRTEVEGRGGPIASGAFMAANAHVERSAPILRAVRSRETALCHHVEPPNSPLAGDDIDAERAAAQMRVEEQAAAGPLSSREFYFLYTDGISACASCHEETINPNFGMEDFDNVGRMRDAAGAGEVFETLGGETTTVSLSGTLIGVESIADPTRIDYQGAKDFSNKIAETDAVRSCLVRRSFRYLTGLPVSDRDLDTSVQETLDEQQRLDFACTEARMREVFSQSGEDPRAMFIELAVSDLLRFRR